MRRFFHCFINFFSRVLNDTRGELNRLVNRTPLPVRRATWALAGVIHGCVWVSRRKLSPQEPSGAALDLCLEGWVELFRVVLICVLNFDSKPAITKKRSRISTTETREIRFKYYMSLVHSKCILHSRHGFAYFRREGWYLFLIQNQPTTVVVILMSRTG